MCWNKIDEWGEIFYCMGLEEYVLGVIFFYIILGFMGFQGLWKGLEVFL